MLASALLSNAGRAKSTCRRTLKAGTRDCFICSGSMPNKHKCRFFFLPPTHAQELRFIFPALPLFNLAIGVGMSKAVRAVSAGAGKQKEKDDDGSSNGDDSDSIGGGGGRTRSKAR